MDETVIVTLLYGDYDSDFELPWKVPLRQLYPRLAAALQEASRKKFGELTYPVLKKDGYVLANPAATLWDYGVCTGDRLTVEDRNHL